MNLYYEVIAKIERTSLDGTELVYHLQGGLTMAEGTGEPLQIGWQVPKELWDDITPGDIIRFELVREPDPLLN